MKKQIILAVTGLLLIGGLSACGKRDSSSDQSEVNTSALHKNKVTTNDINAKVQQIQADNYKQISAVKYHKTKGIVTIKLVPKLQKRVKECFKNSNKVSKMITKDRNNKKKMLKHIKKNKRKHIRIKSDTYIQFNKKDIQTINTLKSLNKRIQGQIQKINNGIQDKNTQTGSKYIIESSYIINLPKNYQNTVFYKIRVNKNARKTQNGRGKLIKINF